jgi:hypothetical protein
MAVLRLRNWPGRRAEQAAGDPLPNAAPYPPLTMLQQHQRNDGLQR